MLKLTCHGRTLQWPLILLNIAITIYRNNVSLFRIKFCSAWANFTYHHYVSIFEQYLEKRRYFFDEKMSRYQWLVIIMMSLFITMVTVNIFVVTSKILVPKCTLYEKRKRFQALHECASPRLPVGWCSLLSQAVIILEFRIMFRTIKISHLQADP